MPRSLPSAASARPAGDRPFHCGASVAESPNWLVLKWMKPTMRTDFGGAQQGGIARCHLAFRRQRPLRGVDGEEAAVQSAFHHAGIIDLGEIGFVGMAPHHVPAGPRQADRCVEMGVQADQPLVQGAPTGLCRGRQTGQGGERDGAINHQHPP
jgi:hypothetical protein